MSDWIDEMIAGIAENGKGDGEISGVCECKFCSAPPQEENVPVIRFKGKLYCQACKDMCLPEAERQGLV